MKRSKYRNKPCSIGTEKFRSQLERDAYLHFVSLRDAGKILRFGREVSYPFIHNGELICKYVLDYLIIMPDYRQRYVEVKGYVTQVASIKMKLWKVFYGKALGPLELHKKGEPWKP